MLINKGFLFVFLGLVRAVAWTDKKAIISKALQEYCPTANVCRRNSTTALEQPPGDRISCCTDCSCDSDCEETRCCFQNEGRSKRTMRGDEQCLFAASQKPPKSKQLLYLTYFMVTEPPVQGCNVHTKSTVNYGTFNLPFITEEGTARTKTLRTTFKRFHPVSSKSSGKIFKNLGLANCHGENDTIPWTPVFVCDRVGGNRLELDISVYAQFILNPKKYSHCRVKFHYPGNSADVESERCFPDVIDKCENSTFSIPPAESKLSQREIREACESDLFSPYSMGQFFANVFCYICNGHTFDKNDYCYDVKDDFSPDVKSLVWILKTTMGNNMKAVAKITKDERLACPTAYSHKDECRPVHCPSGKLRTYNDSCVWPFVEQGYRKIDICLKLIPSQPLTVDELEESDIIEDVNEYPASVRSPWPESWETKAIWYVHDNKPNSTLQLLLVHLQTYTNVSHEDILGIVAVTLPKQWQWERPDKTVYFDQHFSDQMIRNRQFLVFIFGYHIFTDPGHTEMETRKVSTLYKKANIPPSNPLKLTKMFFCEQIELRQDEFELERGQTALIVNESRRIVLGAEFGLIEDNNKRLSARICLSDSNFVPRVFRSSGDSNELSLTTVITCVCLYAQYNLSKATIE